VEKVVSDTPNQPPTSGHVDPVEAAHRRRRIPVWAIALFPALLVWAIIYVNGVTEPPASANTPEAMGAQIYGKSCGGCHGVNGEGGAGPAFSGGDLDKVFPKWQDQIKWVDIGTQNWTKETGETTFGATKKPLAGTMPGFGPKGSDGSLSCEDIALVVQYERETLHGMDPEDDLNEITTAIAAGQTPAEIPGCTS
jgi:mono/diheme cytochrome c family protein